MQRFLIPFKLTLLSLGLVLFLGGCSKGQRPDEKNEKGQTKIVFWHAMGGALGGVIDNLIKEYNNSQENYYIHTEFMGRYDILEQKIIASVMAGQTPDVAQMYEASTMLLTRDKGEESLIPLNPFVEKWDGFDDLFDIFKKNSTYDKGNIYSIPFNKSFPVLFYNQEILDLVGEQAPRNWEEMARICRKIQKELVFDPETRSPVRKIDVEDKRKPILGYAFAVDPWIFEIMLLQNGGKLTNEDQSKVFFDTDMSVDAMSWFIRAIREGWAYRVEGYQNQNDFGSQKVAFIITSSVSQKFMKKKLNFKYGVAATPAGKVRPVSIMSGTNVCIFEGIGDNRKKGAWDFIRWLNRPEITARWAMNTFYVPTRKSALKLPEMQNYIKNEIGGSAAIDQVAIGDMEPRSSAWYKCRIILRTAMEKIISIMEKAGDDVDSKAVIQKYFKEATRKMNKELLKYKKSSS